jgi:hypothetical protein
MKLTDHITAKAAQYGQNGMMIHMMAHQALIKAGHEHRVTEVTPEQVAIIDAEIERRLGGKRVNGKRVN